MFNLFGKTRQPKWYPNQRVVRDRWGTPVSANIPGAEFRSPTDAPGSVASHMRWSLGLM